MREIARFLRAQRALIGSVLTFSINYANVLQIVRLLIYKLYNSSLEKILLSFSYLPETSSYLKNKMIMTVAVEQPLKFRKL